MDVASNTLNKQVDEYKFPKVLVSTDVESVPIRNLGHVEAGRVISVDVCTAENNLGENMIVWTLTYAATPVALENRDFTSIDFAFPVRNAASVAMSILAQANNDGSFLIQDFVYAETAESLAQRHYSKLRLFYESDNAGDIASMILLASDRFEPNVGGSGHLN